VSPALPIVSDRDVIRALAKTGFSQVSQRGSHGKLRDPAGRTVIVPLNESWLEAHSVPSCGRQTCRSRRSVSCSDGPSGSRWSFRSTGAPGPRHDGTPVVTRVPAGTPGGTRTPNLQIRRSHDPSRTVHGRPPRSTANGSQLGSQRASMIAVLSCDR